MNVVIDDIFVGISCSDYESLYFDEAFNEAVGTSQKLGRKLLHFKRTPEQVVRHVCYEPDRDPASPAGQAFGKTRASFVEELDYDPRTRRGTWRTIPNLLPDRVTNAGTIEFIETPEGTRRIVRAEVKARLFGFGGLVERAVIAEIVKSYARTTEFTRAWLARR